MEVKDLIKANVEQPRYDNVIITLNKVIDFDDEMLDEVQYVIAKGESVRDLEPGMKVRLNLESLSKPVYEHGETTYKLQINPIEIETEVCAIISDRVIKTIIKE